MNVLFNNRGRWISLIFIAFIALISFPPHIVASSKINERTNGTDSARLSAANCTWVYVEQTLSHFARGHSAGTYKQRLCVYSGYWQPQQGLPIFLYTGNESPVEEYVNNTGLLWTLAEQFQALVIFAEHRYFGASVPEIWQMPDCVSYLSADEALADYASLANRVRRAAAQGTAQWWDGFWSGSRSNASNGGVRTPVSADKHSSSSNGGAGGGKQSAIIAFGGSYGGMLASWLRIQYPSAVDGGAF